LVIESDDGRFSEGEVLVKGEFVYLEKADAPTSLMARGVPMGLLMLTTKRLIFLSKDRKDTIDSKREFLSRYAYLKFTAMELERLPLGIPGFNFDPFLDSEYSFAVPLKQIVSCKKFGNARTLNGKKRFLRIGIADDSGAIVNYCVYFNSPIGSSRFTGVHYIHHADWLRKINAVTGLNREA
jgi:hypothetical protein